MFSVYTVISLIHTLIGKVLARMMLVRGAVCTLKYIPSMLLPLEGIKAAYSSHGNKMGLTLLSLL